ncbi:MAG: alanine--tRNA ligase, partial [Erysipelotrichaceae bacterium]|nr:alanine--tRNA ligase [Erysipelotrichaceae bacterium]
DSEIFYDRGPKYDPEGLGERLFFEEMENDRYIEVWNVVFSQYDAKEGVDRKDFKELPQKNIDTGMGLERLTALIQDGETNFDTDLFLPIIRATEKLAKYPYEGEYKMAYRVIADHIRTVTFAISDGASFSNEGRGYVLRRVLRRAVRFGKKLGIEGAFMYNLVQVVADNMQDFYPYLQEKVGLVARLVKIEEETFHTTLTNGERLLMETLEAHKADKVIPGSDVFKLYDTYGFPKELTCEIAEDNGYTVDMDGFNAAMKEQKDRARASRSDEQSMASQSKDLMDFTAESEFTGYSDYTCTGKVIGMFKNGVKVDILDDSGDIILDRTCFYAESGGQVADTGTIKNDVMSAEVTDCKKAPHKQHLMHIEHMEGTLKVGDVVEGSINVSDREMIRANHSSLHLLQSALKQVLGDHVAQAGSYVCKDYGRFDFNHYEKIKPEDLEKIENTVNEMILSDRDVVTEVMSIEDAQKTGATALFDEKYGDTVRVVTMGEHSKEFCGGTHAKNIGELGLFKIISEESIGSGVRRITCKTKQGAYSAFKAEEATLDELAKLLKMNSTVGIVGKLEQLIAENTQLKKDAALQAEKMLMLQADETLKNAVNINGINVLIQKMDNFDNSKIKSYAETLRNKAENGFIFLINEADEKLTFACACSKAAIDKGIKAGDMIKLAASLTDGRGGGKPDVAQGGGKDVTKVNEVIEAIKAKC